MSRIKVDMVEIAKELSNRKVKHKDLIKVSIGQGLIKLGYVPFTTEFGDILIPLRNNKSEETYTLIVPYDINLDDIKGLGLIESMMDVISLYRDPMPNLDIIFSKKLHKDNGLLKEDVSDYYSIEGKFYVPEFEKVIYFGLSDNTQYNLPIKLFSKAYINSHGPLPMEDIVGYISLYVGIEPLGYDLNDDNRNIIDIIDEKVSCDPYYSAQYLFKKERSDIIYYAKVFIMGLVVSLCDIDEICKDPAF